LPLSRTKVLGELQRSCRFVGAQRGQDLLPSFCLEHR